MQHLHNRRAVITGAGSGIGAAIARAYAVAGARLLLADRDPARLAESAQAAASWALKSSNAWPMSAVSKGPRPESMPVSSILAVSISW